MKAKLIYPIERENIIWAAGLFEGEGCVTVGNSNLKTTGKNTGILTPYMSLTTTDKDVLDKFHRCIGGLGKVRLGYEKRHNRKTAWIWSTGGFCVVQAIAAMIFPFLGERRQARITEILKAARVDHRFKNESRFCTVEGCTRRLHAKGLCQKHHSAQWYYANRERALETHRQSHRRVRAREAAGIIRPDAKRCSESDCEKLAKARGLCSGHYSAVLYKENPEKHREKCRRFRARKKLKENQ